MSWKDWILPPAWQQKASQVTRMMVAVFNGEPAWTPRNYEDLAKEGYEQNIWVYRCINAIAQAVAAADWVLYSDSTRKKEIDTHKLLDLLNKPNEFMSKQEFFEAVTAFLCLSGNGYIESNGPNSGPPMELFPLRPDRMQVIPDSKNLVSGYLYTVGEDKYTWKADKVAHIKLFSPLVDLYGMSPIEVAARSIDNDNAAATWNNALLTNGARPTGAMQTDSTLTDPQYDRLTDQIATQYKGAKNAGRPMLLEGGLKWQEMGLSPRDMDFIESKKMSRVEICAAFGVPPEMVGDKEHATYSNYQEARQAFYQDTVLPYLDKMRDKLNAWLVPKFGENLFLDYDKDSIEALQENTDEKAKRIREDVKAGILMLDEGRTAMGYEEVPNGMGKVFYIPNTARVVDEKGNTLYQPEPPAPTDPGTEPPPDDEGKKSGFFFEQKHFTMLESEESKTMYWKAVEGSRETFYGPAITKLKKYFEDEKAAILKAYEANGDIAEVEKVLNKRKKELGKLLTQVDLKVIEHFGQATLNQLKHEAEMLEIKGPLNLFNVFATFVMDWIASTVAKKVVQIPATTMGAIQGIVSAGIGQGLGIKDIAKQIDSLYLDQIIPNRSTVIARTEVISASNAGSRFGAIQTGLPVEKEWIATRDDRTRDTHTYENGVGGQVKLRDEYYELPSGVKLMQPGDPQGIADGLSGKALDKAVAKEVIQCRCAEGYKVIKK